MNDHVMVDNQSWWHRGAMLIPAFTVAVLLLILWVHVDRQDNATNARITADKQTSALTQRAFERDACTVYAFFLNSYSDQARTLYQAGPAAYDTDMHAIVLAAQHNQCGLHTPAGL